LELASLCVQYHHCDLSRAQQCDVFHVRLVCWMRLVPGLYQLVLSIWSVFDVGVRSDLHIANVRARSQSVAVIKLVVD
jgi:hypothetical protein